jgi:hypothetical protein
MSGLYFIQQCKRLHLLWFATFDLSTLLTHDLKKLRENTYKKTASSSFLVAV